MNWLNESMQLGECGRLSNRRYSYETEQLAQTWGHFRGASVLKNFIGSGGATSGCVKLNDLAGRCLLPWLYPVCCFASIIVAAGFKTSFSCSEYPETLSVGALSQTPLGELTALSKTPSWIHREGKEVEGIGRGQEKEKERSSWFTRFPIAVDIVLCADLLIYLLSYVTTNACVDRGSPAAE